MRDRKSGDSGVLTAIEAAKYLKAHVETVRRLARKGGLPAFKVGKDWRFTKDALEHWSQTNAGLKKKSSILIIDDDEHVQKFLFLIFNALGYSTEAAHNGVEGLEKAFKRGFDLIILDLQMPVMNGPEFLRIFRKTDPDLPVIIITGYPDSDLMERAMEFGPIMLLAKPLNMAKLKSSVKIALGQQRIEARKK